MTAKGRGKNRSNLIRIWEIKLKSMRHVTGRILYMQHFKGKVHPKTKTLCTRIMLFQTCIRLVFLQDKKKIIVEDDFYSLIHGITMRTEILIKRNQRFH